MANGSSSDSLLKVALIVVAVVVLAPFLLMALFVPMMGLGGGGMMGGYGMGGYGMGGYGGGLGIVGLVMPLVWLVVLIGGGYLLYRWLAGNGTLVTDSALEELRLAYARGEISDEEFEERRSKLRGE